MRRQWLAKLTGLSVLLTAMTGITAHADVYKLTISQMVQKSSDIYLYVNAIQQDGTQAEEDISADQLSVELDNSLVLDVDEAEKAGSLEEGISYVFCIDISEAVTQQEMQDIQSSLTGFIANDMRDTDYVRILAANKEVIQICETTGNREILDDAVSGLERIDDDVYLYKAIAEAIDGLSRENYSGKPEHSAVVVFTNGMDASDGIYNGDYVREKIVDDRIPIYIVGLKGSDPDASLKEVSQLSRQSGGNVYSWNDMGINDAVGEMASAMINAYRLHVNLPDDFLAEDYLGWKVRYSSDEYDVSSGSYVFSLKKDEVFPGEDAETEFKPETETETNCETEQNIQVTPVETNKTGFFPQLVDIIRLYWMLFVSVLLVLAGMIAVVVSLIRDNHRRKQRNRIMDISDEDEDGKINEENEKERRLTLTITFDGKTQEVSRFVVDRIILGRGTDCDVDVVFDSHSEAAKKTSRRHAVLISSTEGIYVSDAGSRNKTFLNGEEVVGEVPVCSGDKLWLGEAIVKIDLPDI